MPCLVRTTVHAGSFGDWLRGHFDGWHYSTSNGTVAKTSLAVVPATRDAHATAVVRRAIAASRAVDIEPPATGHASYLSSLHNRGLTLQSRANGMVLTRHPVILVQGGAAGHVATPCALEGFVCPTSALDLVEGYVMAKVAKTLSGVVPHSTSNPVNSLCGIAARRKEACLEAASSVKTMLEFIELNDLSPNVQAFVAVCMAGAVLHTGFSDAGSTFRDRSSRAEAGRHFSDGLDVLLYGELSRKPL